MAIIQTPCAHAVKHAMDLADDTESYGMACEKECNYIMIRKMNKTIELHDQRRTHGSSVSTPKAGMTAPPFAR